LGSLAEVAAAAFFIVEEIISLLGQRGSAEADADTPFFFIKIENYIIIEAYAKVLLYCVFMLIYMIPGSALR